MWASRLAPDVLFFFDGHADSIPLYEALAKRLLAEYPATKIQVRKTQIGFHDGRLYACASLTPAMVTSCPSIFMLPLSGL